MATDLILGTGGPFTPQDPHDLTLRLGPPPGSGGAPWPVAVAATLKFGAALVAAAVVTTSVTGTLKFNAALAATQVVKIDLAATVKFSGAVQADRDVNIPDYLSNETGGEWRDGDGADSAPRLPWRDHPTLRTERGVTWRDGATVRGDTSALPWQDAARVAGATDLPWRDAEAIRPTSTSLPWRDGATVRPPTTLMPWRDAAVIHFPTLALPWRDARRTYEFRALPWRDAAGAVLPHNLPWRAAPITARPHVLPWRDGALVESHGGWPWPPVPEPPVFHPPVDLVFCVPWVPRPPLALPLVLGLLPCQPISGATQWVPIRSVYMQVHTITAVRLPDLLPLDFDRADISTDDSAFGWSLSASGPAALLDQLAPVSGAPAQVRLTVDGIDFVFVIEGLRRNRAFGNSGASVAGRSLTALLGDPYLPPQTWTNGSIMTAQQLIDDALTNTGVTLDWGITDWLVPAGAWSFRGSPLEAALRVAGAAGAVVQSARDAATLRVLPRYPALPWTWATTAPDVSVPTAAIETEGWERRDRAPYNGVYISGQNQGVLGFVRRLGSAGDVQAAMVTDALITHDDAARQRGESILGAAGPQADMTIEMPVFTGPSLPGIVDVGKLLEVTEGASAWRGLVRGVTVRLERVSVRQTLRVERHL